MCQLNINALFEAVYVQGWFYKQKHIIKPKLN